jgi:hypothetical protein
MHVMDEFVQIECSRETAALPLDKRGSQTLQLHFMFFKQPEPGAQDIAGAAITSLLDLLLDEVGKVIAERDRRAFPQCSLPHNTQ